MFCVHAHRPALDLASKLVRRTERRAQWLHCWQCRRHSERDEKPSQKSQNDWWWHCMRWYSFSRFYFLVRRTLCNGQQAAHKDRKWALLRGMAIYVHRLPQGPCVRRQLTGAWPSIPFYRFSQRHLVVACSPWFGQSPFLPCAFAKPPPNPSR
jgi:hypothetical protein